MSDKIIVSRRNFLRVTGMAAAGSAALGAVPVLAQAVAQEEAQKTVEPAVADAQAGHHSTEQAKTEQKAGAPRGRMFFTNDLEFFILTAAAERIFPKDENGPGAKDLGVPYFVDNQLAGSWGYNAREYTAGPHFPGAPTQGWQTPLLRRDLFRQGLLALNSEAQARHTKSFHEITPEQQDEILKSCEGGKIKTDGFTSGFFFAQFRAAVLAGVYADPIYAGNSNMDGWRMKGYPGAQMTYSYLIENDAFQKVDPMSLADM